jgi:ferredoxin-NADP reductase
MEHQVYIKLIKKITHDVLQIVTEKPANFSFTAGQAADISITKDGWKEEKRPFTFTSLPSYDYLEFVIKTYPSHQGLTNQLLALKKDDVIIVHDVFGDIAYKGEGLFIAGGAGITPFISIFRDLQLKNTIGDNKLIYANKTKADIILKDEFENILDTNFINILSDERSDEYAYGHINEDFIKKNRTINHKYFYVCGPPPMMDALEKQLMNLGIEEAFIIKEGF